MTRTHINLDDDATVADVVESGSDPRSAAVVDVVVEEHDQSAAVVDEDDGVAGGLPARAKKNDDGSVTLPLRYPVSLTIRSSGGKTRVERYEELRFHRLNGAALRAITSTEGDAKIVVAMARSTRLSDAVMSAVYDRMDGADIAGAAKIVFHFLA
ncbi:hypothetical protein [Segnochrobactrum spirostomi]|uniref:Phage tail assembly protein n=1 Tax=Segnochrobactrum spirostomi TaxID=2608987 RepID=A0A6A7Y6F5_9HYPH|nr:hypothetical protein [Segnochrobactrum spirostomi]MQT14386.1 hypothetical protein [Segnochrobactrum spirostomi]